MIRRYLADLAETAQEHATQAFPQPRALAGWALAGLLLRGVRP